MKNQMAKNIFLEYKKITEIEIVAYNNLKALYPLSDFPRSAKRVWKYGVLAELWGHIATKLNGGKVNYIDKWRQGQP